MFREFWKDIDTLHDLVSRLEGVWISFDSAFNGRGQFRIGDGVVTVWANVDIGDDEHVTIGGRCWTR